MNKIKSNFTLISICSSLLRLWFCLWTKTKQGKRIFSIFSVCFLLTTCTTVTTQHQGDHRLMSYCSLVTRNLFEAPFLSLSFFAHIFSIFLYRLQKLSEKSSNDKQIFTNDWLMIFLVNTHIKYYNPIKIPFSHIKLHWKVMVCYNVILSSNYCWFISWF